MRVAMVTPYWHPVRGGVTTYVAGLASALRAEGAEVDVLTREGGGPGAARLGGAGRSFARRAREALAELRPDAVHAHGHWYALDAAVRHAARAGGRTVFTLHTELVPRTAAHRLAISRLLGKADVLTTLSEDLMARTKRTFRPRTEARVVPPGCDVRRATAERAAAFLGSVGLADRRPVVTFLGPLQFAEKCRGVGNLIDAMAVVRRERPEARLLVVGDGAHRAALEARAARANPGGTVFLDAVDDTSLPFTATDVHAHISFLEGFGLAVLEAMACGAPVVANAVGGIPEMVRHGETGVVVKGEADDVAEALLDLLGDPARARAMGERAARDVAERYRWDRAARAFLGMYGGGR